VAVSAVESTEFLKLEVGESLRTLAAICSARCFAAAAALSDSASSFAALICPIVATEFVEFPRRTDGRGFDIGASRCSWTEGGILGTTVGCVAAALLLNRTRPFSFFASDVGDPSRAGMKGLASSNLSYGPGSESSELLLLLLFEVSIESDEEEERCVYMKEMVEEPSFEVNNK
jgi:hypothetical protein